MFETSSYSKVIGACCKYPLWPNSCVTGSDHSLWILVVVIAFPCLVLWAICICKRDFDKFDSRGCEDPNVDPSDVAVSCASCGHDVTNLNFCDQCGSLNMTQWDQKAAARHRWNDPSAHVFPARAPHTLPVGYTAQRDPALPPAVVRAVPDGAAAMIDAERGVGAVGAATVPAPSTLAR